LQSRCQLELNTDINPLSPRKPAFLFEILVTWFLIISSIASIAVLVLQLVFRCIRVALFKNLISDAEKNIMLKIEVRYVILVFY